MLKINNTKQYYIAVGTESVKLVTLLDFLEALYANKKISIALCCSYRDAMDELIVILNTTERYEIFTIFPDMTLDEIENIIKAIKIKNKEFILQYLEKSEIKDEEIKKPCLLVTMDSALPFLKDPIGLEIFVNYDLPYSIENAILRQNVILGNENEFKWIGWNAIINFIISNQIEMFNKYETFCEETIEPMPLHISDIFEDPKE